ncbi:MAG TPA: lytic transglycosylase domain-containing protein [Candidatus Limnocylindria bacterium]|nr:lytic transglycosylase domain-containing protein [Candidatus Limnocylindria bacterium]
MTALVLQHLLASCAPNVGARTMTAVIRVESGGDPLAIHDNTIHRSFAPRDVDEGVAWADQLLALHHSIDLGLGQINDANLPGLGMSIRDAFDPCANVHGAAAILAADYRMASGKFGAGQYALRRALGAYNSGSLFAGDGYIDKILAAAGVADAPQVVVPDLQRVAAQPPPVDPVPIRPLPVVAATPAAAAPTAAPGPDPYGSPILAGAASGAPAARAATPPPDPNAPVVLTPEAAATPSPGAAKN